MEHLKQIIEVTPELQELFNLCKDEIEGDEDEGRENYIYESAMELFYGKNIWDFINVKYK